MAGGRRLQCSCKAGHADQEWYDRMLDDKQDHQVRLLLLILAAFPSLGRIAEISEYGSNLCIFVGLLTLLAWVASRTVLDLFPLMPLLRVFCLRAHQKAAVMVV